MSEVTRILSAIGNDDPDAADQLLPLVYQELRLLASRRLAREGVGQTIQATELVHDAYLRLVDVKEAHKWSGRGHFFAAAAEAMRRILVDRARAKRALKRGGTRERAEFAEVVVVSDAPGDDILAISEALDKLSAEDPAKASLVKLRYFCGMSIDEAAGAMGISRATACRYRAYAKAWLYCELQGTESPRD